MRKKKSVENIFSANYLVAGVFSYLGLFVSAASVMIATVTVSAEIAIAQGGRVVGGVVRHEPVFRRGQHPEAPGGLSAWGQTETLLTSRHHLLMRLTGDLGRHFYDHIEYGIEVFSRQPQNLHNVIVGEHMACRKNRGRNVCEVAINSRRDRISRPNISEHPIDYSRIGRPNLRTRKRGLARVTFSPYLDLPHTFLVYLKGNSAEALTRVISRSTRRTPVRLPGRGYRVSSKWWVCYYGISPTPDHCKAYLNVETGAFRLAIPNSPTSKLFSPFFQGVTPEGAVIWN